MLNHLHFLLLFCLCNQFSIIYVIIQSNNNNNNWIWCRKRNRGSFALMPTIHSSRTLHLFNICVNASLTQLSRSSSFPSTHYLWMSWHFSNPFPLSPSVPSAVAQNKGQTERHLNHYSQHKARAKQTWALPETSSRLQHKYKYKSKSFQFVSERVVHC